MKTLLFLLAFGCFTLANAQYRVVVLDSSSFTLGDGVIAGRTSFRGLSVPDDSTVWISGSRGTIARSTDGGKTFLFQQIKGYERNDFRDIEAFDDKRAVIMSSGTPAYILKTTDGGHTWKEVYRNTDSAYFLDAMDFRDEQHGMLAGDPVNGHFLLLETRDGGENWQQWDTAMAPPAYRGEALFAASGTSLLYRDMNTFGFVTGGTHTRLLLYDGRWHSVNLPLSKGAGSQGAFSMALTNEGDLLVTGGDYLNDTSSQNSACLVRSGSYLIMAGMQQTHSYKSCVAIIGQGFAIATGTAGTDLYSGLTWKNISPQPFNVVRKAQKGKAVFLAGPGGKIGKLVQ